MKKKLLVGVLVLTLVLGAFAVYASPDVNDFNRGYEYMDEDGYGYMNGNQFNVRNERVNQSNDNSQWSEDMGRYCGGNRNFSSQAEREEWFQKTQEERTEYREENLKRDIENGIITEEEANKWREHFAERDKFHEENGYRDGSHHGGMNNSPNNTKSGNRRGNGHMQGNGHGRGHGNGHGMMGGRNFQ